MIKGLAIFAAALGMYGLLKPAAPEVDLESEAWGEAPPLRDVRVLLASKAEVLRIQTAGRVQILRPDGTSVGNLPRRRHLNVQADPRAIIIGDLAIGADALLLEPEPGGTISLARRQGKGWSVEYAYFGRLRLDRDATGRLTVINLVDVETYLACVVPNEVWPTFHLEAFRAQAIAARTYALFEMERRRRFAYDVAATQASQVYRGRRTDRVGRRARAAVAFTRGIVCTYEDRNGEPALFPTYYGAACGGVTQSAAVFMDQEPWPPLVGGVACTHCSIAPGSTYAWDPVTIPKRELLAKLSRRLSELADFGPLDRIELLPGPDNARCLRVRLIDTGGRTREVSAESFRLAVGASRLRSMHCEVEITGREVIFRNGHGFGHGVGLCQWGMQAQAQQGATAGAILRYYYPGTKLMRAY
jgi:stage II sporulation protein D